MSQPLMSIVLTNAQRTAVLGVAARVLANRWPRVKAFCIVLVGTKMVPAYAFMQWPGIVCVSHRHTGQLLAQSRPGAPFVLDASVFGPGVPIQRTPSRWNARQK